MDADRLMMMQMATGYWVSKMRRDAMSPGATLLMSRRPCPRATTPSS